MLSRKQLRQTDLNLLVTLDALLSERNVTRAAQRLSLGQPAISASLRRLRKLFDDPLLVPNGRALAATPFAELLAAPVAEVLSQVDRLLNLRSDFDPHRDDRTFRVIASDYVAMTLMQPLLEYLTNHAPRVSISITPTAAGYTDQLRREPIDLLIAPQDLNPGPALPSRSLFRERTVCAIDKDHRDVGERMTLELFTSLPHLVIAHGSLKSPPEFQLTALGISRDVEMVVQSFMLAPFLLRGTRLVTMTPERLGRKLSAAAGIRLLEPPVALQPTTIAMFWEPQRGDDPGHRWLRELIERIANNV